MQILFGKTLTKALGSALWDGAKSIADLTLHSALGAVETVSNFLVTPLNAEENSSSSLPMTTEETTPAISNEERVKLKKDYMELGLSEEEAEDLVASLSTAQNEISYSYEDLLEGARAPVSDHKPSEGPKGIETDLEEDATQATQTTTGAYSVKKGDTLRKIAKRHGISLQQLENANPKITNPNFIKVGQKINLRQAEVQSDSTKGMTTKVNKKGTQLNKIGQIVKNTAGNIANWLKFKIGGESKKREKFLDKMTKDVLGKPYPTKYDYDHHKGKGPDMFDCSGGITWSLEQMGYDIDPLMVDANNLLTNSQYTEPLKKGAKPQNGDIIGWDLEGDGHWDHVTVLIDVKKNKIIQASSKHKINKFDTEKHLDNYFKTHYPNYKKTIRRIKW